MENTIYSANIRSNRSSDTAFFIEPYVEKGKERKGKIKTHHNNILDIFKEWGHIHVEPVCQLGSLYKTCIPLYLDVVSSFRNIDKYNDEGMIHLGDTNYAGTYNFIIQIVNLENDNNSTVSQFMCERENVIRTAISNNKNISVKEWISSADEYPFYKLAKIFEHYMEESEQHKELQIVSYGEHKGIHYHKLFRNETDLIAIGKEESLKYLKELIDSESQNTISKLQEFNTNQYNIQKLTNEFSASMESDIHYISTHGISGRCMIEHELGFLASSRFAHLTRFFRRQLLTIPSTYSSF